MYTYIHTHTYIHTYIHMMFYILGAINSLAALRNMQLVEVDWDRVHCLMREKAVDCLSKIKLDPTREV
jgi:hypothetical protein